MPLFRNHSGVIVTIEGKQQVYEALMRGLRLVGDNERVTLHEEMQLLLKVKNNVTVNRSGKLIEPGVVLV